jgi:hypothetical protein
MYMASESDRTWLLNVQRKLYQRSWQGLKPPNFAQVCGEPGADRKTHAGFGERHSETAWGTRG